MPANVETMAYVERTAADIPWHKLGKSVKLGTTWEEMIVQAECDWEVEKVQLLIPSLFDPSEFSETEQYAIRRKTDGSIYGYVGERYEVLQNRDALSFMNNWFQDGTMQCETIISLDGGRIVTLLVSIGDSIGPAKTDIIKPYVLLMIGHDGKTGVIAKECATRVVCANTLSIARHEATTEFKFRHTSTLQSRIESAGIGFSFWQANMNYMKERFDKWAQAKLDEETWSKVVLTVAPEMADSTERIQKAMEFNRFKLQDVYDNSPTVDRGTKYGAFNAVTEFIDWYEPRKGMTIGKAPDEMLTLEKRALYSLEGKGAEVRNKVAAILG